MAGTATVEVVGAANLLQHRTHEREQVSFRGEARHPAAVAGKVFGLVEVTAGMSAG